MGAARLFDQAARTQRTNASAPDDGNEKRQVGGGAGVRGATRASVVPLPFLNGSQAQEPAAHWGAFTRHLCSSPSSAGSIFEPEAVFLGGGSKSKGRRACGVCSNERYDLGPVVEGYASFYCLLTSPSQPIRPVKATSSLHLKRERCENGQPGPSNGSAAPHQRSSMAYHVQVFDDTVGVWGSCQLLLAL